MDSPTSNVAPATHNHHKQLSNSSTNSAESQSPSLSIFSSRPYTRHSGSSSTSSLGQRDSEDVHASKSYLTDVLEEPQERYDDLAYTNSQDYVPDVEETFPDEIYRTHDISAVTYDLDDSIPSLSSFENLRISRSRRSTLDSPLTSAFHRASASLSRKMKRRPSTDFHPDRGFQEDQLRYRASSESSTHSNPGTHVRLDCQWFPPSPAHTVFEEQHTENCAAPIEIAQRQLHVGEELRAQSTTPLLPTILHNPLRSISPVNSPLQSPTVASSGNNSTDHIPIGHVLSPTGSNRSYPSPPLSHQPSMTSICGTIMPQDLVFIPLDQPEDDWSHRLGHANFFIYPEPYTPPYADGAAYRELCQNWEAARQNYAKHLVRTREHYGPNSEVYMLTEEKWVAIEASWKQNITNLLQTLEDDGLFSLSLALERVKSVQVPGLNDPDGKFPDLGDEDIVGPMNIVPGAVAGADRGRNSEKKKSFWQSCRDMAGKAGLSARTSRSSSAVGRMI